MPNPESRSFGVSADVQVTYNRGHGGQSGCLPYLRSATEDPIATKRNTYAKRAREQEKKRRAEDKRARRDVKKEAPKPELDVVPVEPADVSQQA